MKYLSGKNGRVVIEASIEELRALLGIVDEAIEGPHAFSEEEWNEVMVHDRSLDDKLIDDLGLIIDRVDAQQ